MSFILNALRKSEQERQALQPETVTDRILVHQPQHTTRRSAKFFVFLAIGNIFIIAGIVWFVRNNSTPMHDTVTPASSKSHPAQETAIKSRPITESNQPQKPIQNVTGKTHSIAEWVKTQSPEPVPLPVKPVTPKKSGADPIKIKKLIADDKLEPDTQTIPPVPTASINNIPPELPETKPVKTVAVSKDIPFLSDMPFEFRQTIPKFDINVFVYSQHPEERFVMIDMVKYKPGQQIKDSLVLKEIRPDSLVVVYQNQTFQIERP